MESFCSSVVKEAIDGHAAVLMTHTKTGTGNHVGKVTAVANSFKKIKDRNPEPLDLQRHLDRHDLQLKSSHPDALKNLHANLMKVK